MHALVALTPRAPPPACNIAVSAAGLTTGISWSACAAFAMCTYKPHRITHNLIGTSQALTALPLLWGCITAINSEDDNSGQISLGLAVASIWLAVTAAFSPAFTSAVVRTVDPVIYPPVLRAFATITHLGTAGVCLNACRRTIKKARADAGALMCALTSSLWRLPTKGDNGEAVVYAICSLPFATFAAIAAFAPFPLATIPSLLGKRLARAFGAWTLLTAVALQALKDGSESVALRRGLRAMCALHLLLMAARPLLETATVYPAALAVLPATVASLVPYVLLCVA